MHPLNPWGCVGPAVQCDAAVRICCSTAGVPGSGRAVRVQWEPAPRCAGERQQGWRRCLLQSLPGARQSPRCWAGTSATMHTKHHHTHTRVQRTFIKAFKAFIAQGNPNLLKAQLGVCGGFPAPDIEDKSGCLEGRKFACVHLHLPFGVLLCRAWHRQLLTGQSQAFCFYPAKTNG